MATFDIFDKDLFLHNCSIGNIREVDQAVRTHKGRFHMLDGMVKAAEFGQLNIVKYFIEDCNCSVNFSGPYIMISRAVDHGHLHIVKYLVEAGCDPKSRNQSIFNECAISGELEILKYFISVGCNPHNESDCALRKAAEFGHMEMLQYLVSIGCDPQSLDEYALRHSVKNRHVQIVKYLLSLDCKPQSLNYSPLLHNFNNPNLEIFRCLLGILSNKDLFYAISAHVSEYSLKRANPDLNFFRGRLHSRNFLRKNKFYKYILRPTSMNIILTYV
jgi:hypothetical protein